jgi:pimeloyl-ACP methyl ester carboxylesterase
MRFLAALLVLLWASAADAQQVVTPMDLNAVTKRIDANGLTLPVVDHGRGPVVLLLHGFPDSRFLWRRQIAQRLVADEAQKKEELRVQAEQDQKTYDELNFRDDQFDLSDALIALAISLLAITALTHKQWLYWLAVVPTVGGLAMGLAGLFGWRVHPDMLTRLLS